MFECADDGTLTEIPFSKEPLSDDDKLVIVLDEVNNVVWAVYGKRKGIVPRRMALRQAESLRGHGYQVGRSIIGRQLESIKEIDARMLERVPDVKKDFDQLLSLFDMPFSLMEGECVTFNETEAPAPRPTSKPSAAKFMAAVEPEAEEAPVVEEMPEISEPSEVSRPPMETANENGDASFEVSAEVKLVANDTISPDDEKKAGCLVVALLREFNDIYINKKGNHFKIESLEGPICSFTIEDGAIKFSKDSFSGMDPNMKKTVQAHFVSLMK